MSSRPPQPNGNPLIGPTQGDTIQSLYDYVEFLCLSSDGDGHTHPGMVASLRLVLGAVDSLKGEKESSG